jgi:hypothetical protein
MGIAKCVPIIWNAFRPLFNSDFMVDSRFSIVPVTTDGGTGVVFLPHKSPQSKCILGAFMWFYGAM